MLHLYHGADDFRMREAYNELRASLDGDGMLETNTARLQPRGLTPGLLIEHVSTAPFLAEARLAVVDGLLTSLGGGRDVVATWQPLLDFLPQMPPANHLVLLEPTDRDSGRALGRSAFASALRETPGADVREFRELRARGRSNEVVAWARERAAARAVEIEPGALAELVDHVGADLWTLAAEIDKLGRYAAGRAVTAADVQLLTPQAQDANVFNLVDAAVEGHAPEALVQLRRMLDSGSGSPQYVQAMIARQLRNLVRATELLEAGANREAIADATGVRNDYALRKLTEQAGATSRAVAEQGLRAVEHYDHAIKPGELNGALAMELLITHLASLSTQPRRAEGRGRRAARPPARPTAASA